MKTYDVIIIGGGIYGLHAAFNKKIKNKKVLIIEKEGAILKGASYINQARLHNGYHYPRSFETAKDARYFFYKCFKDYSFAMNKSFNSIYAIAKDNTLTNAKQFEKFCDKLKIPYKEIDSEKFFKHNMIEKTYLTEEYVFDIDLIRKFYNEKLNLEKNINIKYNSYIDNVITENGAYVLKLNNGDVVSSKIVISTVYSNINYINKLFNQDSLDIKYELCEVELIKLNKELQDFSITIMDGPFFSLMPFGKKNIHTLTSVNFTPHEASFNKFPEFDCQKNHPRCKENFIENCNECIYRPKANVELFKSLYNKFIKDKYKYEYCKSLFTVKPILIASEDDDSRPTIIKKYTTNPTFISCLSGKFSTVYLLDEFIEKEINI